MLEKATKSFKVWSILLGLYTGTAITVVGWPESGWLAGLVTLGVLSRKRFHTVRQFTSMGTARWATTSDLKRAGMINARSGLILGRLGSDLVRLPQAIHSLIVAPSGAGKNVSLVFPYLLDSAQNESAVVIDFKGENARVTAKKREQMGHHVVLLDPYHVFTQRPDTFNALDYIDSRNRLALDDCNDLANALVVRSEDEKEPHWNDSAEAYIAGMIAAVVAYGERGERSLSTVRDHLSHPQKLQYAIAAMLKYEGWGGALAQMGGQLLHFQDKEKSSVLSTALRHLRFLGTPAIADCVAASSFDPSQLRKGKMTVYLILPPDRAEAQSGLLRMWIGSLLRACMKGGLE